MKPEETLFSCTYDKDDNPEFFYIAYGIRRFSITRGIIYHNVKDEEGYVTQYYDNLITTYYTINFNHPPLCIIPSYKIHKLFKKNIFEYAYIVDKEGNKNKYPSQLAFKRVDGVIYLFVKDSEDNVHQYNLSLNTCYKKGFRTTSLEDILTPSTRSNHRQEGLLETHPK